MHVRAGFSRGNKYVLKKKITQESLILSLKSEQSQCSEKRVLSGSDQLTEVNLLHVRQRYSY